MEPKESTSPPPSAKFRGWNCVLALKITKLRKSQNWRNVRRYKWRWLYNLQVRVVSISARSKVLNLLSYVILVANRSFNITIKFPSHLKTYKTPRKITIINLYSRQGANYMLLITKELASSLGVRPGIWVYLVNHRWLDIFFNKKAGVMYSRLVFSFICFFLCRYIYCWHKNHCVRPFLSWWNHLLRSLLVHLRRAGTHLLP